jgi:hypothetical protein
VSDYFHRDRVPYDGGDCYSTPAPYTELSQFDEILCQLDHSIAERIRNIPTPSDVKYRVAVLVLDAYNDGLKDGKKEGAQGPRAGAALDHPIRPAYQSPGMRLEGRSHRW